MKKLAGFIVKKKDGKRRVLIEWEQPAKDPKPKKCERGEGRRLREIVRAISLVLLVFFPTGALIVLAWREDPALGSALLAILGTILTLLTTVIRSDSVAKSK
jgi:hypothetical protein